MGQEIEQESKKDRVIQAAIKLFSQQGYHDTTVSEIADQAEVAKGTVYWYFDSKKKLFWDLIVSGAESSTKKISLEVNKENKSAVEKLEEVVRMYLNFFKESKSIAKMMQESSVSPGDYFHKKMKKIRTDAITNLAKIIEEGQANNKFTADIEPEEVANFILGSITGSYNPHVYKLDNVDHKVDLVLKIILDGIGL